VGFFEKLFGQKKTVPVETSVSENQGFISTLEREFSVPIFEEFDEWVVEREEVYEIFSDGLGGLHLTIELLSKVGSAEIELITKYAQEFCEDNRITFSHVQNAINETVWHWSEETKDD